MRRLTRTRLPLSHRARRQSSRSNAQLTNPDVSGPLAPLRSGASVTKPEMVIEPAGRFWLIKQVKVSRTKIKLIAGVVALVCGTDSSSWARLVEGTSPGGVIITNQARATYSDDTGETFESVSDTVTLTVTAVASITVTP